MRCTKAAIVSSILLTLANGCSSVVSTQRLGTAAASHDVAKLEGLWITPEGEAMYVKYVRENELRIGGLEWDEGNFAVSQLTAFVTTDEGQSYVNVVGERSPANSPQYRFFRLAVHNNELLLLSAPNVDTFEKAVTEGQISGEVKQKRDSKTVVLNPTEAELSEYVDPKKVSKQFLFDPVVLRRVAKFEQTQE